MDVIADDLSMTISGMNSGSKFSDGGDKITFAQGETQNRGMKYEITPIHPRYEEFAAAKKKHEERVGKGKPE